MKIKSNIELIIEKNIGPGKLFNLITLVSTSSTARDSAEEIDKLIKSLLQKSFEAGQSQTTTFESWLQNIDN
jgi:hypothetical protein